MRLGSLNEQLENLEEVQEAEMEILKRLKERRPGALLLNWLRLTETADERDRMIRYHRQILGLKPAKSAYRQLYAWKKNMIRSGEAHIEITRVLLEEMINEQELPYGPQDVENWLQNWVLVALERGTLYHYHLEDDLYIVPEAMAEYSLKEQVKDTLSMTGEQVTKEELDIIKTFRKDGFYKNLRESFEAARALS